MRKEYRRYALRMCWSFERRGLNTKLVTDVPNMLAEERELAPEVIIPDAAITEKRTRDVLANLKDRPGENKTMLILLDLPASEEASVREQWPDVRIVV
ncbi:MAG: hypothetical protein Q7T82_17450 [Armatimonadota bacterium]|nr:hypothetical protein [Armatimonadota bacterium]